MADIPLKVTLVYGSVDPFTQGLEFFLEDTTHCLTIGHSHYVPVDGTEDPPPSAIRHYMINGLRHGIGISESGSVVGAFPVSPVPSDGSGGVQATGMWVAEPQG